MTDTPPPRRTPVQPAVPMRLMPAPTSQRLVVPFITLAHRDRSHPVWGALDPVRRLHAFTRKLCQVCGQPLQIYGDPFGDRVVLYLRPSDYLRGIAVEPGAHHVISTPGATPVQCDRARKDRRQPFFLRRSLARYPSH
ncbi:hypothetical protein AB0E01_41860 [Nocardia vinacea]|uniref:hypothetical protein n=1 Tax=Nocardia vinacea TaxID=96468 RepID=UPI0033FD700A